MREGIIQYLFMKAEQLSNILSELNLDLDLLTHKEILEFLNGIAKPQGNVPFAKLYIIAAVAIKTEVQRLPAVGQKGLVRTGLSIELFLQHLRREEKLPFLEKVQQITRVWNEAPVYLLPKIKEIARRYTNYLKYRAVFGKLIAQISQGEQFPTNLLCILWIINLYAKFIFIQGGKNSKQEVQLQLLLAILEYFIPKITPNFKYDQIRSVFREQFKAVITLTNQKKEKYENQIQHIFKEAFSIRNGNCDVDLKAILRNEHTLVRFVDDFSNDFSKRSDPYIDMDINELSFLELDKTITPMGIKKPVSQLEIIKTPLNFLNFDSDAEDDEDGRSQNGIGIENNPSTPVLNGQQAYRNKIEREGQIQLILFKPFFTEDEEEYRQTQKRRKKFVINNCQTRFSILKWIQQETRVIQIPAQRQKLLDEMEQVNNMKEYEAKCMRKFIEILDIVCSRCRDKNQRAIQIYNLFLSFLHKMRSKITKQDFQDIVKNCEYLNAFLCMATIIFNHFYKTIELSFGKYCQLFEISIITGFVPLNWLGFKPEMPKDIQLYLYELQQRILFQQIWKNDMGIQLFSIKSNNYMELAIKKRTLKHINNRIMQICQTQITEKDKCNLSKFIEEILVSKTHLLKYNNLYAIFICSIVYCHGKAIPLSKINELLRKNQNMLKITLEFKNLEGEEIAIGEYYDSYFVKEMQPNVIYHRKQSNNTPIKLTPKTATKVKPIASSQKFKFGEESLSKEERSVVGEYRKSLAEKILISSPQSPIQSQSEDEGEDPVEP